MNLERNPTVDKLRAVIKACDDSAGHHVLWVATNGDVHVSAIPKDKSTAGLPEAEADVQLRLETFQAGNEYVGSEAAEDTAWVGQLFDALIREWPKAKTKPTVVSIDQI